MSLSAEMIWSVLPPLTTPSVVITGIVEPAHDVDVDGDVFDYAVNADFIGHLANFDAMGHDTQAAVMAMVAVSAFQHSRRQSVGLAQHCKTMDKVRGVALRRGTLRHHADGPGVGLPGGGRRPAPWSASSPCTSCADVHPPTGRRPRHRRRPHGTLETSPQPPMARLTAIALSGVSSRDEAIPLRPRPHHDHGECPRRGFAVFRPG